MEIFNGTIALIGLIDGVRAYLRTGQIIPRLVKKIIDLFTRYF